MLIFVNKENNLSNFKSSPLLNMYKIKQKTIPNKPKITNLDLKIMRSFFWLNPGSQKNYKNDFICLLSKHRYLHFLKLFYLQNLKGVSTNQFWFLLQLLLSLFFLFRRTLLFSVQDFL